MQDIGTLYSPDDGHIVARNMYRKAINILRKFVHQVGSIYKRLCKDAPSTKHKIYHNISYKAPHTLSKADHNDCNNSTQQAEAWVTYHLGHMDGKLYVQSEQKA